MSRKDVVKRISAKATVTAIAAAIAFTAAPAIQEVMNPLSEVYAVDIAVPDVDIEGYFVSVSYGSNTPEDDDLLGNDTGRDSYDDLLGPDVGNDTGRDSDPEEEPVPVVREEDKDKDKNEDETPVPVVREEKKEENEQKPAAPTSSSSSSGGGGGSIAGSKSVTPVNSSSTESFGPGVSAAAAEEPQTEPTEEADQVGRVLGVDRTEEAPAPKVLNANRSNVSTADTQSMMLHGVMAAQSAILLAAYFVVKRRIFAK